MVFLHLPASLTEEEQMLQTKYAKLRKKKAALKNHNSSKNENDNKLSSSITTPSINPAKKHGKQSVSTAGDAKELAKKLIRAGAINLQPAQKIVVRANAKATGFKRSQGLERKLTGLDNARAGYQPFSATHGPGGGFDTGGEDMNPEPVEPPAKKVKNLYDTFVAARDREERGLPNNDVSESLSSLKGSDSRRQGNTVYVFGYQITEELLKKAFASLGGKIVNISMEVEKNCGFLTFDRADVAERAISEFNGNVVGGIQLKVSMARRQPVIDPINDASSSSTWSTIAASHSQKGSHKDKRELVAYDEDMF